MSDTQVIEMSSFNTQAKICQIGPIASEDIDILNGVFDSVPMQEVPLHEQQFEGRKEESLYLFSPRTNPGVVVPMAPADELKIEEAVEENKEDEGIDVYEDMR